MKWYSIVQAEAQRESLSLTETTEALVWRRAPCGPEGDQLPEGWDWAAPPCGSASAVLWSDVVAVPAGAEAPGVMEEKLTPLEVLTELCWMASFWGLPGIDISSQLSSFSVV